MEFPVEYQRGRIRAVALDYLPPDTTVDGFADGLRGAAGRIERFANDIHTEMLYYPQVSKVTGNMQIYLKYAGLSFV